MKTILQSLKILAASILISNLSLAQVRYLEEVFTNVNVTTGITYAQNFSYFPDVTNPMLIPLQMDIYEPDGDVLPERPLVIMIHTGSYFPICFNSLPTGDKNDSATVEICRRLAKRGYVVANVDYRLGWNPIASNQDIRKGTLFQAVYRSIQDVKCAVRYFRADYANGNTYSIDTSCIALGGQGTGGYIALHAISLDKASELSLPKFISGVTEPTYDFVAGQPFINQAQMGDFEGYGGDPAKNYANNSPGYSSAVRFVFNLSGALGDSTFLEPGDVPTVSFHVLGDPSAPFWDGMVYVPGNPPQPVVDVAGSGLVSYYANMYGNNSSYAASSSSFTDPYTLAANAVNNGQEGLFPFVTIPALQSGPWEWWDSTAVTNLCLALGTAGDQDETGNVYNPNMSKQKAMAYIDTIMGYLCPRMLSCVTVGLPEHNAIDAGILIAPNPTVDQVQVVLNTDGVQLKKIILTDITGRTIREQETGIDRYSVLNLHGEKNGIYMLQIETNAGVFHRKIMKQ